MRPWTGYTLLACLCALAAGIEGQALQSDGTQEALRCPPGTQNAPPANDCVPVQGTVTLSNQNVPLRKRPTRRPRPLPARTQLPTNLQSVAGTVYVDRNHNGQQDPDEPSLPGARLRIQSQEVGYESAVVSVDTDTMGAYHTSMEPGQYVVTIAQENAPVRVQEPMRISVGLSPGQSATIDIPVEPGAVLHMQSTQPPQPTPQPQSGIKPFIRVQPTRNVAASESAVVVGRVSAPSTTQLSPTAPPGGFVQGQVSLLQRSGRSVALGNVRVTLRAVGNDSLSTYTDQTGNFAFSSLPYATVEIRIDSMTLPVGAVALRPFPKATGVSVRLTPGAGPVKVPFLYEIEPRSPPTTTSTKPTPPPSFSLTLEKGDLTTFTFRPTRIPVETPSPVVISIIIPNVPTPPLEPTSVVAPPAVTITQTLAPSPIAGGSSAVKPTAVTPAANPVPPPPPTPPPVGFNVRGRIQFSNQTGLPRVTVRLSGPTGVLLRTTATNTLGNFQFTGVPAREYQLAVDLPLNSNLVFVADPEGAPDGKVALRVGRGGIATRQLIFLVDSVGSREPGAIVKSFLFIDTETDSAGDDRVANATVLLVKESTNQIVRATNSSANGEYSFEDLEPGRYVVTLDNRTLGNYLIPVNRTFLPVVIEPGKRLENVSFVFNTSISLGPSIVYIDANENGRYDVGEEGFPEVLVRIQRGPRPYPARTNDFGVYYINNLSPGRYDVTISLMDFTGRYAPTEFVDFVDFTAGTRLVQNFGYRQLNASIVSMVVNRTTIPVTSEEPLANITVQLIRNGEGVVETVQTNANGVYAFANIRPGNYSVLVVTKSVPPGVVAFNNTVKYNLVLGPGDNITTTRFVFTRLISEVSGKVFRDQNGNGIFEPNQGETPWAGPEDGEDRELDVEIKLLQEGANIDTEKAQRTGAYTFRSLLSGSYTLRLSLGRSMYGYVPTFPTNGEVNLTVSNGQTVSGLDFGIRFDPTLFGAVAYVDANDNGGYDEGENRIANIALVINGNGMSQPISVTTNDVGTYQLPPSTPPGQYTVEISDSSVPTGLQPLKGEPTTITVDAMGNVTSGAIAFVPRNSAPTPRTPESTPLPLAIGDPSTPQASIPGPTTAINGVLYLDSNENGRLEDTTESRINLVTVVLTDVSANRIVATNQSDIRGIFTFSDVPAGSYRVQVQGVFALVGYELVPPQPVAINVGPGQPVPTITMAFRLITQAAPSPTPSAISTPIDRLVPSPPRGSGNLVPAPPVVGMPPPPPPPPPPPIRTDAPQLIPLKMGRLFIDTNANSVDDPEEPGIKGAEVTLLDANGNLVESTETDEGGAYSFRPVPPGVYRVRVEPSSVSGGVASQNNRLESEIRVGLAGQAIRVASIGSMFVRRWPTFAMKERANSY